MPKTLEMKVLRRKLSAEELLAVKGLPPALVNALYSNFISSEAMSTEFATLFNDAVEKMFDDNGEANVKVYLWMDEFEKLKINMKYYHACVDLGTSPHDVSYAIHPIRKSAAFRKLKTNTPKGAKSWMDLSWAYNQIESALGGIRIGSLLRYQDLTLTKRQLSGRLLVTAPYLDLLDGNPFTADHNTRFAWMGKVR